MQKVMVKNRPFGPFPTIIVGAEIDGRPNYTTIGACGVVSQKPVLYVSLKGTHYSTRGIRENGFFSVNIPSSHQVVETDYCGTVSGKTTDKSAVFTAFYDKLGRAPLIMECPMNLLCKVVETIPIFDFEMFLGEIVAAYVNEQCITDGDADPQKIDPMVLMGKNYWSLGDITGIVNRETVRYRI